MSTDVLDHPDPTNYAYIRLSDSTIKEYARCATGHLVETTDRMLLAEGQRRVCHPCALNLAEQISRELMGATLDEAALILSRINPSARQVRKTIPVDQRTRIFIRDGYRCRYCGGYASGLQLDHVLPLARGGTDDDTNLVTSCALCNITKADLLPEEAGLNMRSLPSGSA